MYNVRRIYIALFLFGLVLVSGCFRQDVQKPANDTDRSSMPNKPECSDDSGCEKGVCEDGTTYDKYTCADQKCIMVNYVRDPCQKTEEKSIAKSPIETHYFIDDEVKVGGKVLQLKDISVDAEVLFQYGNRDVSIFGTKDHMKINDQEITLTKIHLEPSLDKRYVVFAIKDVVLLPNEYVLDYHKDIDVLGKKVQLRDADLDDTRTITVHVRSGLYSDIQRIGAGNTKEGLGLKITNIRSNPRPASVDKYAIVRIE